MAKVHTKRKYKIHPDERKGWLLIVAVLCVYAVIFAATVSKSSLGLDSMPLHPNPTTTIEIPTLQATSTVVPITAVNPPDANTLNITYEVSNDMSLGAYGYWALGNYTKRIYARPVGNNSYLATVSFHGTWRSITGARSPVTGLPLRANATGNFLAVYYALVPGKLNTSLELSGDIGSFNAGGTYALLLENESAQMNYSNTDVFNWPLLYFSSSIEFLQVSNASDLFYYGNQTMLIGCNDYKCNYTATPNSYFMGS
jgi:hypothetical protein